MSKKTLLNSGFEKIEALHSNRPGERGEKFREASYKQNETFDQKETGLGNAGI